MYNLNCKLGPQLRIPIVIWRISKKDKDLFKCDSARMLEAQVWLTGFKYVSSSRPFQTYDLDDWPLLTSMCGGEYPHPSWWTLAICTTI